MSGQAGGRDFSMYRLDPLINERAFTEHVRRLAIEGGWLYYHTQDSRRSTPGFPDVVIVKAGTVIFAELKVAKGKVTVEQRAWLDALDQIVWPGLDKEPRKRNGSEQPVEVYVWRPEDFEQIARRLLI